MSLLLGCLPEDQTGTFCPTFLGHTLVQGVRHYLIFFNCVIFVHNLRALFYVSFNPIL